MTQIKFFHPFRLIGIKLPNKQDDFGDDIYEYGFSLDLSTEFYYYSYDWGRGINFRFFGFGLEIAKTKL